MDSSRHVDGEVAVSIATVVQEAMIAEDPRAVTGGIDRDRVATTAEAAAAPILAAGIDATVATLGHDRGPENPIGNHPLNRSARNRPNPTFRK